MQKRNVLNSPRQEELRKKRRKALISKLFLVLGALILLFAFLAYFSRLEGLNIQQIKVEGNKIVEPAAIEAIIRSEIAGKYIWMFPKSNVLIFPESKIEEVLLADISRLEEVKLSAKDRRVLTVNVSEREPKYLWCGESIMESARDSEKCFFMDKTGYIFDEAPYFSGEIYFKFYGSSENNSIQFPLGSHFASEKFDKLIAFLEVLSSMGLKPVTMSVMPEEDVEVRLARAGSELGPKIVFKSSQDIKNTAENLQASLNTEPLLSGFKNNYSSLAYIDLRFGNKVYFKFHENK